MVSAAVAWVAAGLLALSATPAPGQPEPIDLGGTAVDAQGSTRQDPVVLEAGLWADTLTGSGKILSNAHWFRYERTMENSTVLVSATAVSPEASGDQVEVTVLPTGSADDDPGCGNDPSSSGTPTRGTAFGALVVVPDSEGADDPCRSAPALDITVDRYLAEFSGMLPYTIRVVEEAPINGDGSDQPEPDQSAAPVTPRPEDPQSLDGADSFAGAPDVGTGTYAGSVPAGTERLYRVPLAWGQRMAVSVDVPAREEDDDSFVSDPAVNLTLFDPMHNSFDGTVGERQEDGRYGEEGASLYSAMPPVAYRYRFSSGQAITVPGDYFFSIAVSPQEEGQPSEVPYEVSVEVTGDAEPGPDFPEVVRGPDGMAGPEGYAESTPYLVGPGEFRATVTDAPAPDAASGGASTVRRVSGGVLGVLSLASVAAGVVLLRRRRSVGPAGT